MDIKQPKWKTPEYSKRQINDAGDIMRNPNASDEEQKSAIRVIDNWRASHAYPLQVFYMNLRRLQGSREDIIVAQRLKRLKSITAKLSDQPAMNHERK